MDIDDCSDELFGRYQALRIYSAIARLPKSEFATGDLARLTDVPTPQLSKELGRLRRLGLVRGTSRRGDYERNNDGSFWTWCDTLAREWSD